MASRSIDADDAKAQIAELRRQVESLMGDRVTPALANAADRAESVARQGIDYTRQGVEFTREQAEALSERVRGQPLVALLVAGAVGYVAGRLFR